MYYKKWFDPSKPILVAGDSNTYGMGHEDVPLDPLDPFKNPPSKTTWPYYIWEENQVNNISHPGISNGDITQCIYEHWQPNIKVLAVMFTFPHRRDFSYQGYGYTYNPSKIISWSNNSLEDYIRQNILQKNTELFEQFQKMYTMQESDVGNHIYLLKNIIAIQNLCYSNKCKFFWCTLKNFTVGQKRSENTYINWQISQLEKLIDLENFFSINNQGMSKFLDQSGHVATSTGYYDKEAHKIWGQAFKQFIENL